MIIINPLTGSHRKLFKLIYKRFKSSNLISYKELEDIFPDTDILYEDLTYLMVTAKLVISDNNGCYLPSSLGRNYFKLETIKSIEIVLTSIFCPIVVAFLTTLITLWLKG